MIENKQQFKSPAFFAIVMVFLITFAVSMFSLLNNRQMEHMDGMAEEYFTLGYDFQLSGKFYHIDSVPFVYRPPGYSFFIGEFLKLWGGLSDPLEVYENQEALEKRIAAGRKVIYGVQCLLLAATSMILLLWLRQFMKPLLAALFAVMFGINPYSIIFTGVVHYEVVHIFLVVLGGYLLSVAVQDKSPFGGFLIASGFVWGLATLVRPLSLIFPLCVLVIYGLKYKGDLKALLKPVAIFWLAMGLTIMPYTVRNYNLTKRFIPVNAQTGAALWNATSRQTKPSANHYNWWQLWNTKGMAIYQKVTGQSTYNYDQLIKHNLAMEDEFKRQAAANFRQQPQIYFLNFYNNFKSLIFDINSVFIKYFQAIQRQDNDIKLKDWIVLGHPQTYTASNAADLFRWFTHVLTILSIAGLIIAIKERDLRLLIPGVIYFYFPFLPKLAITLTPR